MSLVIIDKYYVNKLNISFLYYNEEVVNFKLRKVVKYMVDIVFPPQCAICGNTIEKQGGICANCFAKMHFITSPFCNICGKPFNAITEKWQICPSCLGKKEFDKARFALIYDESSKPLILSFKHADKTHITSLLAKLMANAGEDILKDADMLIPVPLSWQRLLRRRYNQSALLAKELSKLTKVPFCFDVLKRKRNTKSQGDFNAKERYKNVKGAFTIHHKEKIQNKTLVIIDDVFTTGATVQECAKVLRKNGAGKIYVLALATVFKT